MNNIEVNFYSLKDKKPNIGDKILILNNNVRLGVVCLFEDIMCISEDSGYMYHLQKKYYNNLSKKVEFEDYDLLWVNVKEIRICKEC